jgi:hypothetical protein
MKKVILALSIVLISLNVMAQSTDGSERKPFKKEKRKVVPGKCPSFFIALSTGWNNNTGLLGVNVEVPVSRHFSVDGGVGLSTWGEKFYGGAKYFLKPCHFGWAFGSGITYSTGLKNFQENMETIDGATEPVELDLNPQVNLMFAAYRYWALGRNKSRLYIELGYTVPLNGSDRYTQTAGTPINDVSAETLKLLSPSGIIVAIGFSFGVK